MKDDIETLREFITSSISVLERYPTRADEALAALNRLQARVAELEKERDDLREGINELDAVYGVLGTADAEGGEPAAHTVDCLMAERVSLRKALDDRFAADLKAAKAIFAKTGRTSGFPGVKDVVAYYIAENEKLRGRLFPEDCPPADQERDHLADQCATLLRENDSLRAKLEKAKEALRRADQFITNGVELGFIRMPDEDTPDTAHETPALIRAVLAELSDKLNGEPCAEIRWSYERDELLAKIERAKEALKPFAPIVDLPYDDERICVIKFYEKNGDHIVPGFKWGFFRRARAVLAELAARPKIGNE